MTIRECVMNEKISRLCAENYKLRCAIIDIKCFIEKMKHVEYFIDTAGDEYKYDIDDQLDEILEKIKSTMENVNEI